MGCTAIQQYITPARVKCATLAWKAFEKGLSNSEETNMEDNKKKIDSIVGRIPIWIYHRFKPVMDTGKG